MYNAQKVHQVVQENKQELIDFLVECVQTPSVTGDELAMGKVIVKWIERIGLEPQVYEAQKDRPNIIAEWFGSTSGRRFVFNGHIDVFPPVEGDPGLYGPWSGKIVDGYIYGRGTADMKGGLCASIMAVKLLKEMGFDPKGSVLLSCVSDEENGSKYGVKYLLEKGLLNGDFGICMDVTCGKVLVTGGGSIGAYVTYRSVPGHCSIPHPSIDALKKSVVAINELYKLDARLRGSYYPPFNSSSCLSVSSIHSGEATNNHPAMSRFSIDFRIIPGQTLEWAHNEILGVLDGLKEKDPEFDYTYEVEREFPTLELDPNSEIVKAACAAYEDVMDKPAELYERNGSCDAHHIVKATGMTMPNFGPGDDIGECCQANEKLLIDEYLSFVEIYMMTLIRLLG
ncbi:M20/M25/M40 family metallo-hydrolase [Dehalobacterium formicoaceticum]|uniref:M20/M25/M40 family metallo-hydrolase n=1 Tax=Dehalobacterium formicoaceticum TaxID=51515 RepID=A0ABT1Y1P3_9FIRM|nr:M20/M25/M40 family metallo-hydrolase [Dehalobacterium formicoaceticum]MCR6544782.1 M20/M25/M40 family metallo-hydrolase [Dehalobacterium formicoaceticum]